MIGVVGIAACCAYPLRKLGWESDFGRPWEVDLEESVSKIKRVPDPFSQRFSTVDDYRNYVRERVRGLTLTIHDNGTASLIQGADGYTHLVWRRDGDFDYWLNTKGSWLFPVASMGHGFDRTSSRRARLKFQLEWSESSAAREFIVLRR